MVVCEIDVVMDQGGKTVARPLCLRFISIGADAGWDARNGEAAVRCDGCAGLCKR